ncbi:IS110 family transposase [Enterococcus sp. BWB1-3]|uniref:IS110 family transposase n=1 Tax=Enterococcus sp. BWB1-3 TaxID=2787713 RepID=UPI00192166CC|nr:transposase [Enterococcus sp. BWB1-3]
MKVVYPVCCGIDVHKSFLIATVITTKAGELTPHYQKKRFSTFNNQILALKNWLLECTCYDVCMESTGKYWVPVSNLLEDVMNVTIANPKWVRAVKGNKIARMMLTAIYHILSTGEVWNPTDLYKIDRSDNLVQKQKEKAIKQATKFLICEGVLPDDFVRKDLAVSN